MLDLLAAEMRIAMTLAGCRTPDEVGRDLVAEPLLGNL
jgi:isopentenyl diphosphate isomerase/L-lactate dehydrogenase-like FMN-dependent dehydrogenase